MSEIAEIVIEGPGKNALSSAVMTATLAQVRAAGEAPLLLRGAGDVFSAGLNLKELATLDEAGLRKFLFLFDELVLALFRHPAPVVACVNGHAIAGGAVLALTADVRVSTDSAAARIGLNEVAIGLRFPPRVIRLVRAKVAHRWASRVLLEAGTYPPDVARELGLVDSVAADPLAAARAELATLAGHPREAFAFTKKDLNAGVLDLSAAEDASFEQELLPAWLLRRDQLMGVLKS